MEVGTLTAQLRADVAPFRVAMRESEAAIGGVTQAAAAAAKAVEGWSGAIDKHIDRAAAQQKALRELAHSFGAAMRPPDIGGGFAGQRDIEALRATAAAYDMVGSGANTAATAARVTAAATQDVAKTAHQASGAITKLFGKPPPGVLFQATQHIGSQFGVLGTVASGAGRNIAHAFTGGGIAGVAIAGATFAVIALVDWWRKSGEAAKKAGEDAAKAAQKEIDAVAELVKELREQQKEARVLSLMKTGGVSRDEARGQVEREDIRVDKTAFQAQLTGLRQAREAALGNIAAGREQLSILAAEEKARGGNALSISATYSRALDEVYSIINAERERLKAIDAQREAITKNGVYARIRAQEEIAALKEANRLTEVGIALKEKAVSAGGRGGAGGRAAAKLPPFRGEKLGGLVDQPLTEAESLIVTEEQAMAAALIHTFDAVEAQWQADESILLGGAAGIVEALRASMGEVQAELEFEARDIGMTAGGAGRMFDAIDKALASDIKGGGLFDGLKAALSQLFSGGGAGGLVGALSKALGGGGAGGLGGLASLAGPVGIAVTAIGELGSAIKSMVGALFDMFMETRAGKYWAQQMGKISEKIAGAMDKLTEGSAAAAYTVGEMLDPIFKQLFGSTDALLPLWEAVFNAVKWFGIGLLSAIGGVKAGFAMLQIAIGSIVEWIGSIFSDSLEATGKAMANEGRALMQEANEAFAEVAKLEALTFKGMLAKAKDEMDKLAAATREATESMTNVPRGFAASSWRYRAGSYEGEGVTAHAAGGIVTRPTLALLGEAGDEVVMPLKHSKGLPGGMGGTTINIGTVVLPGVTDFEAFARELERRARVQRFSRQGSPVAATGRFALGST